MSAAQALLPAAPRRSLRMPFDGEALVSVIVPTRNRRELLARALRSVLDQSYPRLEVLVVDDGSDDGSAQMVAALGDARLRWLPNEARCGAGYSRHRGAGFASGDYIAFLDSDDWWLADKLWIQLEAAEAQRGRPVVVICPPACDDGYGIVPVSQPLLRPGQPIADYVYSGRQATVLSSCLLVDGELGRRVRFDPQLSVNQDTDYLLKLERSGASFVCVGQPLYVLDTRRRADRISYNGSLKPDSRSWFEAVSGDWSRAARRGYLLWDLSVRYASTGHRLIGLLYYIAGFSLAAGPYRVTRQLLRVLGGGEVPGPLRGLRRRWWRRHPDPMEAAVLASELLPRS